MIILEHEDDHIVEVVYQPAPLTALEHADYTIKMKRMIEKQTGAWALLVDQRPLTRLDDKLKDKMLALYTYAIKRGMIRSARVVNSGKDALRLSEIIQDTEIKPILRIFTDRREAFDWLAAELRLR
jgi:hypothetical protein